MKTTTAIILGLTATSFAGNENYLNWISQNRTVVLKNIDDFFEEEGLYTMEVLHQTPFGVDLLDSHPLNIKHSIRVRGMLYSSN